LLQSGATGGHAQLLAPPRPPQISEADWNRACIRNPDPKNRVPTAIVGADSLQARAALQQERAAGLDRHTAVVRESVDALQNRQTVLKARLEYLKQTHQKQRSRLLKVMKYVEVTRCFNLQLLGTEREAQQRLEHVKHNVIERELVPSVSRLVADPARLAVPNSGTAHQQQASQIPDEQQKQWMKVMAEHRKNLGALTIRAKKEHRDLQLIRDRILASETMSERPPLWG
jgi:Nucleoporin complex subunit 54